MKRSEINRLISEAIALLEKNSWKLPPFAFWDPQMWKNIISTAVEKQRHQPIFDQGLGWDLSDFGTGDFMKMGLLLFTMRNGTLGTTREYAEKIMLSREGQITPWHFHWQKTEDIINRGGGNLIIEVYNASTNDILQPNEPFQKGDFDQTTPVTLLKDGILEIFAPGSKINLKPGESVALPPRIYHTFYGEIGKGTVIVGEISKVNNDTSDNRFYNELPRFAKIVDDEPIKYVLCNEYDTLM